MNPLAVELNDTIAAANPYVLEMLSDLGKSLYFPKGILSQSGEAKEKASLYNATIGTALEEGMAMNLPCVMNSVDGLTPNDVLLYAPSSGVPELRSAWMEKLLKDNPAMVGLKTSLPLVTNGLTHGLSLLGDLFLDPGDILLLPDKIWGNYRLIYQVRRQADIRQYSFFADGGFNLPAFEESLKAACAEREKVFVLLNFPNNPTGYTPTEAESEGIAAVLIAAAEAGTNIVAVTDDAYFGLFYGEEPARQSLFTKIAAKHPRLLAVKADAATKEAYVWGLRVGFLTYAVAGADDALLEALEKKTGGCIRSMISNCSRLSQKIVLDGLQSGVFFEQRAGKVALMEQRALKVKEVLADPRFDEAWTVYPFNSGYFMCLELKGVEAEALRVHVLDKFGIGTIALSGGDLRIAFSCLEVNQIADLFDKLLEGWKDLSNQ